MRTHFRTALNCSLVIGLGILAPRQATGADYGARLCTRLGVEKEVEMIGIDYEDDFVGETLERLHASTPPRYVALQIETNTWIAVHIDRVERLSIDNGQAVITTVDSVQHKGKLMPGRFTTWQDRDTDIVNLTSLTQLSIVSRPAKSRWESYPFYESGRQGPAWSLRLATPHGTNYVVRLPQFVAYHHFSGTDKQWVGYNQYVEKPSSGWTAEVTKAFRLRLGDEEIDANIVDFKELTIGAGKEPTTTLTANTGHKTSGQLLMRKDRVKDWGLVCELAEWPATVVIVKNPQCDLRRLAEPSSRPVPK